MANNDAQTIKVYIKGVGPNVPRVPNANTQKRNRGKFEGRPRDTDAGIDEAVPGTGITGTAGAVIYKDGAKGSIEGKVENNRADTGGIMASGEGTQVNIKNGTAITKNVGVQFGGGSTAEQGGAILMQGGTMSRNVAWFGGGAVYATENGIDWLQGRMSGSDGLSPQFDDRKDGIFFMEGGELTENTALTRGGAVLADSDGVNIQAGKLSYNMSRMLGGAMYVMGDHPRYEYKVFMTKLYVHDNAAVSGVKAARDRAENYNSDTLKDHWGESLEDINDNLQTLLQNPSTCADADKILDGKVTGGRFGGNTDDWKDLEGTQGTGGGVWLCAYGNTVFEANEPDKVVINNNYATGAQEMGGGRYQWNSHMSDGDKEDVEVNSAASSESRSGVAGGTDFHADTGNTGTVVINGLTETGVNWVNENTKEKYESTVSGGRLNLVNKNTTVKPEVVAVEVVGNIARHGGGLAADGTFFFGTLASQATPGATIDVQKEWAATAVRKSITIRATVKTSKGDAVLADVPLDGVANPPESEYDTVQEYEPVNNIWRGEFAFPMSVETDQNKTAKLYTLVYTGTEELLIPGTSDMLTQDTELDPGAYKGRAALAAVLEKGKQDEIKVLFGEPEYATSGDLRKIKKENGAYKVEAINISYSEYEENPETGELELCDDYIFIPGEMDLSNLNYTINATPQKKTTINDEGEIVETDEVLYTIYLFGIPLTAPMSNDNLPITEKYVNKDVHSDIVNFDQEFTYDIMAYVPLSATEFTITDSLVKGLEFADQEGEPSTTPKDVITSIAIKTANNHQPGKEGSVSHTGEPGRNGNPINMKPGEEANVPDGQGGWKTVEFNTETSIYGDTKTLTVKIPAGDTLDLVKGKWVQLTFCARIEDKYRSLDDLKTLAADPDNSWKKTDKNNMQGEGPDGKAFVYNSANGDLNLVAELIETKGEDEVIWAVEAPSRLFAKTARGDYYATGKDDKDGTKWTIIDKDADDSADGFGYGKNAWVNADNRYNGKAPHANNTRGSILEDESKLAALKALPKIKGEELQRAAEGASYLFAETRDAEGNFHYYATTDKTYGKGWTELTPADGDKYNNAIARLSDDIYTIRMLDLTSEDITLDPADMPNWPVITELSHEGMANQAEYTVKYGNSAEGTYKTNTVTVVPETTELDIKKVWDNTGKDEWPEDVENITFGIWSVKDNKETPVNGTISSQGADDGKYMPEGDEQATYVLSAEKTAQAITNLPKLKGTKYVAREIKINDKTVTYNEDKTAGQAVSGELQVFVNMSSKLKDERFRKAEEQTNEDLIAAAKADNRLWVITASGKYYATAEGDVEGTGDDTIWTEIAEVTEESPEEDIILYGRAEAILGTMDKDGNYIIGTDETAEFAELTRIFTALNTQPGTEKYVNNDVHADIVEFDKAFKYDIMVYVPAGSTELTITDPLKPALEFAKKFDSLDAAEMAAAEKAEAPEDTIASIVYKAKNDHTAGSTVAGKDEDNEGVDITPDTTSIEDNILTVYFKGVEDPANAGKKLPLDFAGNWVQVTFWAKYTDHIIEAANIGDLTKINDNGAVISEEYPKDGQVDPDGEPFAHDGTVNKAKALIKVANDYNFDLDTNEVTVKPETINIHVQKRVLDTEGKEEASWPEGLSVKVNVLKNIEGSEEEPEIVHTFTLEDMDVHSSDDLPKLVGVTYTVEESDIVGEYVQEGEVTGEGTKEDPFVITNKEKKFVDVEITKKWTNVISDDIPSVEDFEKYLVLMNGDEDVTELYADLLEITAHGNTYKAKWTRLPDGDYSVDEKEVSGYETSIDGDVITNTKKPSEEKPEIEKYVNQAVHKEIELDEVFTYDIIAYVTKDADKVTITDVLNDMLTFDGDESDVKVVDLGEADNHKVTNNIENVKINDNATVAEEGEPIDAAVVTIDGQELKVEISNTLRKISAEGEPVYTPVEVEVINPKDEGYFEKIEEEYVATEDRKVDPEKIYYKIDNEEDGTYAEVTVEEVDPSENGYYEQVDGEYVLTEDVTPDDEKTYYEKEEPTEEPEEIYEYDGEDQPVTALRGHWIKVTFDARINGKTLEEVKAAYQDISADQVDGSRAEDNVGNAPVISAEDHTGIPNDTSYTIGVANEAGIQEDVYKDASNIVTVKPKDKPQTYTIRISKKELGGDELEGATIKVTGPDGFEEEWESSKEAHELQLKPGEYEMREVVAPEGYQQVTTVIRFKVDEDGKVTLLTTTVDGGGRVSLDSTDHIILEDAPEKEAETTMLSVVKVWDDKDDKYAKRPPTITFRLFANGEPTDKTLVLDENSAITASQWTGLFEDLPLNDEDGNKIEYGVTEEAIPYYKSVIEGAEGVFQATNIHRPWFDRVEDDSSEHGQFTVQKKVSGNVPSDRTYDIKVTMTFESGRTYTETVSVKPGDTPYLFDHVKFGTKVDIEEVTTGYKVTYTVNGKEQQQFTMDAGEDAEVIVLNEELEEETTTPEEASTKPEKTTQPTTAKNEKARRAPKTGDNNNMIFLIGLLAGGALLTVVAGRRLKRR